MATGGGGAIRLAVDASAFEAQMTKAINQFMKYSVGVQAAAFASTTFNSAGKLTDGVIRAITSSGGQMEVAIKKVGRGYEILNQNIRQASAAQVQAAQQAEQAAAREAKAAARRQVQVSEFRKEAALLQKASGPKSLLPAGVTPVRTRLFQGALQDLEDFVRRGKISAKRAVAIIDEVNTGINRRQKNPQHEEYRLNAMRLVNSARNIRKEIDRDNQRTANKTDAQKVQPAIGISLGQLPGTAPAGAQTRMQGYLNSIARTIETTTDASGVAFKRFQEMLSQFAAGTLAPTNAAERQIAKTFRSITAELQRETERQAAIVAKQTAVRTSTHVAPALGLGLGILPGTAPAGAQTRMQGYKDAIAKMVQSSAVDFPRFQQLLSDFASGTAAPMNTAERNLVRGFQRITNEISKETDRQAKITQRTNAQANSRAVAPALQAQFGQLQAGATPAAASRLEGYQNRIARAIESSTNSAGVNLPRFRQLLSDFATGAVAPMSNAERQIVKSLRNIQAEMERDATRVQKIQAQAARNVGATNAGQSLYRRIGVNNLGRLSEQDQERVQQQVARIQRMVSRQNNPLSSAGFTAATNAGFTNAGRGMFQGVDEEARKSAARIRAIMTGQLNQPFKVHFEAAQRDFQTLRNGLTLLFAGDAIRRLSEGFEQLVTEAAQYQRSIALIQTITQEANVTFGEWASSIEKVSNNLGRPIEEVAQATYDLLSNQVTSGLQDSMQVMNTAAQFARVTNSGIEDSVNLLSSAINTFKMSSGDAERVAAQFFTTIDLGRVRTGEMANTIGRSAVYAQTLGVTLEELQAGIITITQTGQKADSSFTLLNNVFQKLLNPTKELQTYYDELGVGTGELFVKTYGFTGALQKLQEATGGSTAKLSDFFNEIRAFGGIDALISRSKQFKGALDELGNSTKHAEVAKKQFDNLPGQRFLQEMTKLQNTWLTGFKSNMLNGIIAITDFETKLGGISVGMGGLANVLVTLGRTITIVGVAIGGAFITSRIISYVETLQKAQQMTFAFANANVIAANRATIGWGALIIAVTALIILLQRLREKQHDYSVEVTEISQTIAEKQKAINSSKYSDLRAQYAKDLASERQSLLARVADYVTLAQKRVQIEKEASKKAEESTKNAYENVLASAGASLEALKSKQQDALKFINDFRQTGPNRIKNSRDDSLFHYRIAKNDAVNNGDVRVEKKLYQDRIRQLNNLARNAAKGGDHESAIKFLDEKDQLINELSTKTVQAGGQTFMKYTQVEEMLRKSALYRLGVEQEITNVLEKRVLDQQNAITQQQDSLKELADLYKAVYDMDLTQDGKEGGKPKYKTKEEFDQERDKRVAAAAVGTNTYLNRFGRNDPTMSQDLMRRQFQIATGSAESSRAAIGRRFDAESALERGQNAQQKIITANAEAEERHKLLTKRTEEIDQQIVDQKKAFVDNFLPHENQNTIKGEPMFGKPNPDSAYDQYRWRGNPAVLKKAELMKDIEDAQKVGNYDLAAKKIEELMELYRQLGLLKKKIVGADGEDTTIEANLNAAKVAVRQLGALAQEKRGMEESLKAPQTAQTYAANALKELETEYGKVGDASNAVTARIAADYAAQEQMADSLIKKLEKIVEMQRQIGPTQDEQDSADYDRRTRYSGARTQTPALGGPIRYFQDGGGPKGTDTIPAWLTPGEYVVNAKQAQKYQGVLAAINAGRYATGGPVYRASGGETMAGIFGGGIFAQVKTHNADWVKKQRERAEKIMKFNEVMRALEEQGVDGQTRARMIADFYHPKGKIHRDKMKALIAPKNRGAGVWDPQSVSDGADEDDYEYHAVGGWAGQGKMPGRIRAMNSGFGSPSETHTDSSVNVGDINITVQGGNSGKQTAEQMGRELNRAIRRKSINLRGN